MSGSFDLISIKTRAHAQQLCEHTLEISGAVAEFFLANVALVDPESFQRLAGRLGFWMEHVELVLGLNGFAEEEFSAAEIEVEIDFKVA